MFRAQRCDRQRQVCAKWRDICNICNKRLPSGFWKLRHQQIHQMVLKTSGRKYHCTNCNKRFKEIANYIRHCGFHSVHTRSQHTKEIISGKHTETDDEARVTDTEKAQDVVITTRDQLPEEVEEKNPKNCVLTFGPNKNQNGEVNKRQYQCDLCGRVYITKLYFDLHVKKHKGFEHFKCDLCQKSYNELHKLNVHKRKHHKAGFLCSTCGQRFPTKDILIEHRDAERLSMRTCDVCGKIFTTMRSLHIHQRIHNGERPFKCTLCEASFTQQYHLLDHERTHSGATPFACKYCDLSFTTHSSRRRHEKNIHKIGISTQVHKCDVCQATFLRKDVFNRHVKQHEKIASKARNLDQDVKVAGKLKKRRYTGNKESMPDAIEPERGYCKVAIVNGEEERTERENVKDRILNGGNGDNNSGLSFHENNVDDLNAHRKSEESPSFSAKEQHMCYLCVKQFSSHASLSRHRKNVHKYGGNGAICEICKACYINRKSLQRHLLQVHNIKTVQEAFQSIMCELCGALVQTVNGLDIHRVKCH